LFAELWRNTENPAKPPTIRIGPDDFTPGLTCPVILTQHIAMATGRDPWEVLTALEEADDQGAEGEDWDDEDDDTEAGEAGTVVTMTEGSGIWWPPNFGPERKKPA